MRKSEKKGPEAMKPLLRHSIGQHDLKTVVRSNFRPIWLRSKLLHFWQAALANSAYLVFPQTSMYSGFYWKLLGNALIKLDPPKN